MNIAGAPLGEERADTPPKSLTLDEAIDTVLAGHTLQGSISHTALDTLRTTFGLRPAEVALLALAAGAELDERVAETIGVDSVTLDAIRDLVPDIDVVDIHRSGLLRQARLIDVDEARPLRHAPVRIDLDILAHLLGRPSLAGALRPVVRLVDASEVGGVDDAAVDDLATHWFTRRADDGRWTVVLIDGIAAEAVAAHAAERAGFGLGVLDARVLRDDPRVTDDLAALWSREAALHRAALFLDVEGLGSGADTGALDRFLQRVRGPVAVGGWSGSRPLARAVVRLDAGTVTPARRRRWWRTTLGDRCDAFPVERLAQHFALSAPAIDALVAAADLDDDGAADRLWRDARLASRGGLDELATRIEHHQGADRLVVPQRVEDTLDAIVSRVEHQPLVYDEWGWSDAGHGRGVVAVFAGPSGTGKTLAAETIARRLDLDLYRIDLATTVSKWIGETEKHLSRIFDAAESSGAVLLFDEADAVFGRRTEVRDSHDRYANLEVSYLLQRLESYNGLAILTTNMGDAIDDAFRRRFGFVVEFPMPGAQERAELWSRALPADAICEDVDIERLTQLAVTGGAITNIALDAAFRAAASGTKVSMRHLRAAAVDEYAKAERSLTAGELVGFPS